MNFTRGNNPLKGMGIGLQAKREFNSVREAAEWAYLFPGEFTEGVYTFWNHENFRDGRIQAFASPKDTNYSYGKLHMVKWMKDNIKLPGFGNDKIGLKEAKEIIDTLEEIIGMKLLMGDHLMRSYNMAIQQIYEHVGFKPDYVVYPIDDRTDMVWTLDGDSAVRYAETEEKLLDQDAGDYYEDEIYRQRFYDRWIYIGEAITMIFCDTHTDGMKYFAIFDNNKRK